jgi:hypothetical protein
MEGLIENVPSVINYCSNRSDIAQLFSESYEQLFYSVVCNGWDLELINAAVMEHISSGDDPFTVIHEDVANAVHHLKLGKRDGEGKFSSYHFINMFNKLFVPLALLITGMFCHGFVIIDMKTSCIIPIPKKQAKRLCVRELRRYCTKLSYW